MKLLKVCPKEALILDTALKQLDEEEEPKTRWFLIQLGRCIVSGQDVEIGVEEEDLWALRNYVFAQMGGGKPSGVDVLIKLYTLLVEIADEEFNTGLHLTLTPTAPLTIKESDNARNEGSSDKSPAENNAESAPAA